MTVMAYRGHAGGDAETAAVAQILEALPDTGFRVARHAAAANGPVVGHQDGWPGAATSVPGGIRSGHFAKVGTWIPPSKRVIFQPR